MTITAVNARLVAQRNFLAGRLACALIYLNVALSALEEVDTAYWPAVSAYRRIAAERQGLIATFRATAARAGWDAAKIEEVCS